MADNNIHGENSSQEAEQAEGSREFAARRTVIKGLVSAVPVVLTVSSGEALANASNPVCIVNNQTEQDAATECITSGTSDHWVREENLMGGDPTPGNGNCLLYVDESGNESTKAAGGHPFNHSCATSFM